MAKTKLKHRVVWAMNPVTRTVPSKRNYKRTKAKRVIRNEINSIEGR